MRQTRPLPTQNELNEHSQQAFLEESNNFFKRLFGYYTSWKNDNKREQDQTNDTIGFIKLREQINQYPTSKDPDKAKKLKPQLAATLVFELTKIKDDFAKKIKGSKDTTLLKQYFSALENCLQEGKGLLAEIEKLPNIKKSSVLKDFFIKADEQIKKAIEALNQLMAPHIYKIKIPKEVYAKMKSNTFHYEGRGIATGKSVGGALVAAGSLALLVGEVLIFPILVFDAAVTQGGLAATLATGTAAGGKAAAQGISRYGLAIKEDIKPEWVAGEVTVLPPDDKAPNTRVINIGNHLYDAPGDSEKYKVFYTIDGHGPEDFLAKGTNYSLGKKGIANPHGHAILFENPQDALLCSIERAHGRFYDPLAGWRRNNEWKPSERAEVHASIAKAQPPSPASLLGKGLGMFSTAGAPAAAGAGASAPSKDQKPKPPGQH